MCTADYENICKIRSFVNQKYDNRDVGSTADLVLVFLVLLVPTGTHGYPLVTVGTHWYPLVLDALDDLDALDALMHLMRWMR